MCYARLGHLICGSGRRGQQKQGKRTQNSYLLPFLYVTIFDSALYPVHNRLIKQTALSKILFRPAIYNFYRLVTNANIYRQ